MARVQLPASAAEAEAQLGSGSVVVSCTATWAAPCAQMNNVFAELSAEYTALTFVQLDADDFPDLCERFGVESVPYFLFLHDGKVTEAVIGANAPELTLKVKQNALTAAIHGDATVPAMPSQKQSLHARLSALTRRSPVMLFMKGSADAPRCGFSRQIVEILQARRASRLPLRETTRRADSF
eukprot:6193074-Pleurochrysis_carterae.AAC.13